MASASLLLAGCTAATVDTEANIERRAGISPSPLAVATPESAAGEIAPKGDRPGRFTAKWFTPVAESKYERTGIASWYGGKFHGRRTANGEVFDKTALTAAHPTLPLPSYVRVTNLKNDRSLIVRVNDRGPYSHNRLIDVSERTAALLDFKRRGKAEVRVEYIGPAPRDGGDESYLMASYKGPGEPFRVGGLVVATAPDPRGVEGIIAPRPPLIASLAAAAPDEPRPGSVAFAAEPEGIAGAGAGEAVGALTSRYGADDRILMAFESASALDGGLN